MTKQSVVQQMMATDLYQSGRPFTPREMADLIGADRPAVSAACGQLRERCEVDGGYGSYSKVQRNPLIHKRRLAPNPPKMFGERGWVTA